MARSIDLLSIFKEQKSQRTSLWRIIPAASLLFVVLLLVFSIWLAALSNKEIVLRWSSQGNIITSRNSCENQCRPPGSETLPKGIVENTSNLDRRPLWGSPKNKDTPTSLFAIAVGLKQKENVDRMVKKFLASDFIVMLFHYDGIVDEWRNFEWGNSVIHISVDNQTKWWFAKRFLHPDIVAGYDYVFLWDEDLGVENFDPKRYLRIVKEEGLEISQPALDIGHSEVHHLITAWQRTSKVHRRVYNLGDKGIRCDNNSSTPPCTGWIEVMAPVFSCAAWRCVWYMIQNDLIHAWGLDMRLGHCAQGDRMKNIGVVDAEYIVHYGLPTLGEPEEKEEKGQKAIKQRVEVRRQSYNEYKIFKRRWKKAGEEDECWQDPYPDDQLDKILA